MHPLKRGSRFVMPCLMVLAMVAVVPHTAGASLIGDQVQGCLTPSSNPPCTGFNGFRGLTDTPADATVADPGVEFTYTPFSFLLLSADFTADTLTLTYADLGSPLGTSLTARWFFDDLDWAGGPGGITSVVPIGSLPAGVTFSFTSDSINVITDISNQREQTRVLQFQIDGEDGRVPGPGAAILLLSGLAGLGALRCAARRP